MGWFVWANSVSPACATYAAFNRVLDSFYFSDSTPTHINDVRVFGPSHPADTFTSIEASILLDKQRSSFVAQLTKSKPAEEPKLMATCNECCPGGACGFGTQGSPFWCSCCQQNCGGYLSACQQQGYGRNFCVGGGPLSQFGNPKNGDIYCGSSYHTGSANWAADVQGVRYDYIGAAQSGTVTKSDWDNTGYGNIVIINHGSDIYGIYAHLDSRSVSNNQGVNRGQQVGAMGNSGTVDVHLHFHLRNGASVAINPNGMPGFRNINWPSGSSSQNCCIRCASFA